MLQVNPAWICPRLYNIGIKCLAHTLPQAITVTLVRLKLAIIRSRYFTSDAHRTEWFPMEYYATFKHRVMDQIYIKSLKTNSIRNKNGCRIHSVRCTSYVNCVNGIQEEVPLWRALHQYTSPKKQLVHKIIWIILITIPFFSRRLFSTRGC